jgi:small-conductance mechanosensitive channel
MVSPLAWSGARGSLRSHVQERPAEAAWTLVALFAAGAVIYGLRRRRRRISSDAIAYRRPARVLVAAIANGAAWGTLAVVAGNWFASVPQAPVLLHAMGEGLLRAGPAAFLAGFIRALFDGSGGTVGAEPRLKATGATYRFLAWQVLAVVALMVASRMLFSAGAAGTLEHGELGARLMLLVMSVFAAACVLLTMSRRLADAPAAAGESENWRTRLAYAVAGSIPILFVVLLLQGFTVGVFDLARGLIGTMLVLIVAGTVRVLFLNEAADGGAVRSERSALRAARLDLLHVLIVFVSLATLAWIWRDVYRDLLYLQHVVLWTTETVEGLKTVTVANLISSIIVVVATLTVFKALPLVFAPDKPGSKQHAAGTRYAAVALLRYVVLLGGLIAAFSALNIGWSKLQWMAAGLSVGLGFGLQDTAANFFSGLTLLSERSIRVGDTVTVGDKTGVIRRIQVRATTLEDYDGREIVIPNKELVSTQVTNWTLKDPRRRLHLVVGVAYGSDTALVANTLLEAARQVEGVLPDPAPQAVFEQFGASALQFRLYVWIAGPQDAIQVNHDLHVRIETLFRESRISIDLPERDIRLHPAGPLEVRLSAGATPVVERAAVGPTT